MPNNIFEALTFFDIKKGYIVTLNQNDRFQQSGRTAEVVSCHDYFKSE